MRISGDIRNRIERIYLFANHDYYLRYYGSRLGILWAFINPFFQILIYYLAFSFLIFKNSDPNFVLYIFTGIIFWDFFAETSRQSINLFQKQRYILQNIALPKIDFFWSLIASKLWGFIINLIIFFLFDIIFFNPHFSTNILYLFPILIGLSMFTLGISFFLATLYIYIRDLDHLWSIVLLAGFWLIPIIWDYKILYENYHVLLYVPLTAFAVNFREVLIYDKTPDTYFMWIGILISFIICVSGYIFMRYRSKKALEFL